jgi:hypothetical protein
LKKKKREVKSNESFFMFEKEEWRPEIWVEKNLAQHDPIFAEMIIMAIERDFFDQIGAQEERPKKLFSNLQVVVNRFDVPQEKFVVTKSLHAE